jgi:two-component system, LytTR family, response regulator LytT
VLKTIAIDDEPLALQLVTGFIKKTPFLELKGEFDNPLSAMEFIEHNRTDLIFLDIQMPDLLGTDFAKNIKTYEVLDSQLTTPKVIITTAHEKYAIEGYKLDIVDYLLKPFGYDEFLLSAQKARKVIETEEQAYEKITSNKEFLFLKSDYKIKRINFDDILYIEGLKDYVKVYSANDTKPILSLNSLKTLEAKLPVSKFMRVHKSFIVNVRRIQIIERNRIVFGNEYIPIGDQYKEKFQEFLKKNFL